jgi:hypothetical protein
VEVVLFRDAPPPACIDSLRPNAARMFRFTIDGRATVLADGGTPKAP